MSGRVNVSGVMAVVQRVHETGACVEMVVRHELGHSCGFASWANVSAPAPRLAISCHAALTGHCDAPAEGHSS